jgi:hypothetical protein
VYTLIDWASFFEQADTFDVKGLGEQIKRSDSFQAIPSVDEPGSIARQCGWVT